MYEQGLFHSFKPVKAIERFNVSASEVAVAFCPSPACLDLALEIINEAKKYIYVSALYIDHEEIIDALIKAKQKGVDVRIILDTKRAARNTALNELMRVSGLMVKIEDFEYKMHTKAIFSESALLNGSMNFSHASIEHNDENVILVKNSQITRSAGEFFNILCDSMDEKYLAYTPLSKNKALDEKEVASVQIIPKNKAIKAQNGRFYTPLDDEYDKINIEESKADRYFCSPYFAKKAGYLPAM